MANCGPTAGLALPCKNFMPGVRKIFIASFYTGSTVGENLTYTADANNIVTAATLSTGFFYTYDLLKEAGEVQEKINTSPTTGLVSYEDTLNVYLSQYSTATRNKIVVLAKSKLLVAKVLAPNAAGYTHYLHKHTGKHMQVIQMVIT